MKNRSRILWLMIVILAVISLVTVNTNFSFAYEPGNYPGKWYGWWHPWIEHMPPPPGCMPEWENQKVIKSWGYQTGNSLDETKHLFPGKAFYEVCLKNPEIWGNFRINETAYLPWRNEKWLEATEKYKGEPTIDEKGHIRNYKAGLPFPGTQNPIEMAWNLTNRRQQGDCYLGPWIQAVVDKRGHTRWVAGENNVFFYSGRLNVEPKPRYEPNPKNIEVIHVFGYSDPYDLRGTVPLEYRYDDPDKQDDMWMYLPSLRRVRRMSVAQRWDKVPGGSDLFWDCFQFFWGKPTNYEWKNLGRKELFCGHNTSCEPQMIKDKHLCGCDQYQQRVNCVVLEATPKPRLGQPPISRMVMYLDPNHFRPYWGILYDRKGREWIIYYFLSGCHKDWFRLETNMHLFDVQRTHSSNTFVHGAGKDLDFLTPEFFTMDHLKRHFGGR